MSSESREQVLDAFLIEAAIGLKSLITSNTDDGLRELLVILDVDEFTEEMIQQALVLFDSVSEAAVDLADALDAFIDSDDEGLVEFYALAKAIGALIEHVCSLDLTSLDNGDLLTGFGEHLISALLVQHFLARSPTLVYILIVLGVIETIEEEGDQVDIYDALDNPDQLAYEDFQIHEPRFRFDRLAGFFSGPASWADDVYGWLDESKSFEAETLLKRLCGLAISMGYSAGFLDVSEITDHAGATELRIPIIRDGSILDSYAEMGICLQGENGDTNDEGGRIRFIPYVIGDLEAETDLDEQWQFIIRAGIELSSGIAYEVTSTGLSSIEHGSGFESDGDLNTSVSLTLRQKQDAIDPVVLFKSGGISIELSGLNITLYLDSTGSEIDFGAELGVLCTSLVLSTQSADSFLKRLISDGARVDFGWSIGWSDVKGLYFQGSAGLDATFNLHYSLGPLNVDSIRLNIEAKAEESTKQSITTTLSPSFIAKLGPLTVVVKELPVNTKMHLPSGVSGASLDDLTLSAPPGIGLSLNAGGIVGGGFLEFDDTHKRYAGIMALSFGEIGLTAIGLISTQMPDGSKGYSLLVNIGVTFNPAIQLPYGFSLAGVGGLIGLNRSVQVDVLRAGLKNRTLDSILFPDPKTVIANASKIISDLRAVFPPTQGQFVVGPMVKFGWGANIITADVGIMLELPDPVRVILLGQVTVVLPEEKSAVVALHLDILGVLDFEKSELTFQASMYDSRILTYPLYGDAAFLLAWGDDPRFALSIGGFHPKFTPPAPPALFAELRRITLSIDYGKHLQLRCQAYQALTPNSLQFGARVDLYASHGSVSVTGVMTYDALIYFSPFTFEAALNGSVRVRYKGKSLANIDLSLVLTGPAPWVARGRASINILFVKVKIRFCYTWGPKKVTLESVDPWLALQQALQIPSNWGGVLPDRHWMVESIRGMQEGDAGQIIVHPAGRLEFRQNVVPLGVGLAKVGNAPITGHDQFDILDVATEHGSLNPQPVEEFFARGQFEALNDQQKLSLPSFEKMKGGIVTSSRAVRIEGGVEHKSSGYESIIINADLTSQRQATEGRLAWDNGQRLAAAGVRRRAIERAGPGKQFTQPTHRCKVNYIEERYCIAHAQDLTRAALPTTFNQENRDMSRMLADQTLATLLKQEPGLAGALWVIAEYEVFEEAA
jgi:hypothetical protein